MQSWPCVFFTTHLGWIKIRDCGIEEFRNLGIVGLEKTEIGCHPSSPSATPWQGGQRANNPELQNLHALCGKKSRAGE